MGLTSALTLEPTFRFLGFGVCTTKLHLSELNVVVDLTKQPSRHQHQRRVYWQRRPAYLQPHAFRLKQSASTAPTPNNQAQPTRLWTETSSRRHRGRQPQDFHRPLVTPLQSRRLR